VWLRRDQVEATHVEVAPVGEHGLHDEVVTVGRVVPDDVRVAHVFSPVTGRVVRISAQFGQPVRRGDVLATIESPDVGAAVADMHRADADRIAAHHAYERQRSLFGADATSRAALEQSEDAWRRAEADMSRARQMAGLLHAGNVEGATQTYSLVAPVDGEVLMRNVNPDVEIQGQYGGGQAQELFTVGDLRSIWVFADVYEVDIGRVGVGTHAYVTVTAYPNEVRECDVDWVSDVLDPQTRTAKARCTFSNQDGRLRPEMYASVRLDLEPRQALAVPRAALVHLGEYDVVFTQIGEANDRIRFERVPVEVDRATTGEWVEVKRGLSKGQALVVRGGAALSQAM
jgi:cobalt-zinc-cadmium efflux system membrane fusion protein